MKKIEFIAPVEAMRGKLSGNQTLLYAENDNPAFESPKGQRNYARNYRPSFIGAKVSSTGKVYFSVKTKSAVHMTQKAIQAMALQGATGALVGALLASKSEQPYLTTNAAYMIARLKDQRLTFRKYVSDKVRAALIAKAQNIAWTELSVQVSFKNPWYDGTQTTGAEVDYKVLAKFWEVLCPTAATFTIDGAKCICVDNSSWDAFAHSPLNEIGVSIEAGTDAVKLGEQFVLVDAETAAHGSNTIANGDAFILSDVMP